MGLLGPVVGRLYDRVGARALLVPGTVVTCAALWSTTFFTATSPWWAVIAFHVALSVGLAFVFTPLFTAGLGAVEPRLYSYGSAIFGTTQQLAGAAGVALLVSVLSVRAADLADGGAGADRPDRGRDPHGVPRRGLALAPGDPRRRLHPHPADPCRRPRAGALTRQASSEERTTSACAPCCAGITPSRPAW